MAEPSVPDFYAGKNIFITGATGFVGKALVEKLIRSCPNVGTVYLLMRKKRNMTPKDRIKDFISNKFFEPVKELNPTVFNKLRVIAGDLIDDKLGISEEDRKELQENCNIIFHSAACVRFDLCLKEAMELNTVGTIRLLQLAETMKNLMALLHLSTAYCRCELPYLDEKIYPPQYPSQKVVDLVQWMDEDLLKHIEPKLIAPEPNTYAFTKALSEALVADYSHKYPIAIARPSIVTAAWREPIQGWVDNLNGPTGLIIGAGKGVIRSMHCESSYYCDAVPVDVVVNACILAAFRTALDKPTTTYVYNVTLSDSKKFTWGELIDLGRKWVLVYPFQIALWYPGGSIKSYWLTHQLCHIFGHIIPAYAVDSLLLLLGKKRFMVKIQHRVSHGLKVLQYYTTKQWHFINVKCRALSDTLNEEDKKNFYMDLENADVDDYLKHYILGMRKYCCKEELTTLPKARKLLKFLYYLDIASSIMIAAFVIFMLYSYSHFFSFMFTSVR